MGQVLHGSARSTIAAVRRAIQHSQESLRALARRHGVNQKTISKRRKRSSISALGTPDIALYGVTGLDTLVLTRVVASLLTPFCILVPFWLIWAYSGFKAKIEVWPILVARVTFGFTQFFIARIHGPWLVDISASIISLIVFVLFLRIWKPKRILNAARQDISHLPRSLDKNHARVVVRAAVPWIILTLFVTVWGTPHFTAWIDNISTLKIPIHGLDHVVFRMPPVVPAPIAETAAFTFSGSQPRAPASLSPLSSPRWSWGCAHELSHRFSHANGCVHPLHGNHYRRSPEHWLHRSILWSRRCSSTPLQLWINVEGGVSVQANKPPARRAPHQACQRDAVYKYETSNRAFLAIGARSCTGDDDTLRCNHLAHDAASRVSSRH